MLPREFQQVEYIQSSNNAYIDTTIYNNIPIEFECNFQVLQAADAFMFGTYAPSSRWFVQPTNNGNTSIGYCGNYQSVDLNISLNQFYKFSGIITKGEQKLYIDDILLISTSFNGNQNPAIPISIFCANNGGTTRNRFILGRMKSLRFWTNSELILDFIPCYRKEDNQAGMYDKVSKSFFTRAGSGAFIAGPEV